MTVTHDTGPARQGSLFGRAAEMVARRARRIGPANDLNIAVIEPGSGPVSPLPMTHGLEMLAARCGKPVSRAYLTAAIPVNDGDMDSRFAPFAMARVGLDARWQTLAADRLSQADLPAMLRLHAGGVLIVTGLSSEGEALIIDGRGERTLPRDLVTALTTGEMLVCGAIDPENGLDEEEERALLQRNPKLWLFGLFMGEKKRLAQLMLAGLLLNLCALIIPLYMRAVYDRVVPNLAIESLWALSAGVVVALGFELMFKQVRGGFVDGVGVHIGHAVQHRAMRAILHARMNRDGGNAGVLMTGLKDVEQLALMVPQALVIFAIDLPCVAAVLLLIGMIGGWTMLAPAIGAIGMVLVGLVANFALKLASKRAARLHQARSNLIVEISEGWSTIKANQAEGRFLKQWDILSDHVGMGAKQIRRWNDLPGSASGFLVQLVTVLVVIIGVFQIKDGAMTTGALVACTLLAGRAMVPVSAAIAMGARLYQSLSQFTGLANILKMEPERAVSDPAIRAGRIRGAIALSNVGFTFEEASEPTLKEISLSIEPGEKVALIGKSGSGKSTLLQLLSGMIRKQNGTLTVDGHGIDQYAIAQLRQSIVHVAQDAAVFDMSIWENILLGLPEPDVAVVERAVRAAGLDTFVDRTAEGYARRVGPRGTRLSGGQRQSLVLARALVRDPAVLLLDEPTAAMDIHSEQVVINGLRSELGERTLIVATHRLALLDLVDRVIWLDEGRIVADKPRTEVLAMLARANAARASGQAA